jgi:hypothetical protein
MISPAKCGVVYVATGAKFVAEAAESRQQLRRSNPEIPAAIFTDVSAPTGDWQQVVPLLQPTHSLRDKLHMRHSPWELTLFLDTDTYVAAPLQLLFDLLQDGFDLIGHQLFEGHNYQLEGVPDAFPEFNTGVIGFRRSAAVQAFFDSWTTWYDSYAPAVSCDQRSFRKALYTSRLRHSVLTPEYNFRPLSTNFAITDLRIIHGRPLSAMPALKKIVDVNYVHRAYVPRLGCVVSDVMTPHQAWRLWCASSLELLKTGSRPFRHFIARLLRRRGSPSS